MSAVTVCSDWSWQRYDDHGYLVAEFDIVPEFGWRRMRVLGVDDSQFVSTEWHFGVAHPDSVDDRKLRVIHAERDHPDVA